MNTESFENLITATQFTRIHGKLTHQKETVGQRYFEVAMLCLLMNPKAGATLLRAAILRDFSTLPYIQSKKDFEISDLSEQELKTLSLAEFAQSALFCVRETKLGNRSLEDEYYKHMAKAWDLGPVGEEFKLFNTISEIYQNTIEKTT